ncbi:MAG: SDR family NAD(P)-dependent oxidoreductase [Myxococcales bacterium]
MRSLRGRTAVVTGAASGIGRALARKLARAGMHVVLADKDLPRLRAIAAEIPGALAVRTDVSRAAEVEALAARAYARFGAVHLLCNNAGVADAGPIWEVPLRRLRRVLEINLWGAVHGCRAFLPRMIAQGGPAHVLNTASMAGLVTPPLAGAYALSKHGVVALSEGLVQDLRLRRLPIGVSVLCPAWVATRLVDASPYVDPWVRALVAAGLAPEAVAREAIRAVRQDRFYVLTHPAMAPAIEARARRILSGRAPGEPLSGRPALRRRRRSPGA